MSNEQYEFLRMITYGTYNELFEVIDVDGIRKPAIRTKIRDIEPSLKGDKNFDKEFWTVEIDWRLLDRWKPTEDEE